MSVCPRTGITQPECSCPDCLTDLIRRHQPALLEAEPVGVIGVSPATRAAGHAGATASHRHAA